MRITRVLDYILTLTTEAEIEAIDQALHHQRLVLARDTALRRTATSDRRTNRPRP